MFDSENKGVDSESDILANLRNFGSVIAARQNVLMKAEIFGEPFVPPVETWSLLIEHECVKRGETTEDVVASTLLEADRDRPVDTQYDEGWRNQRLGAGEVPWLMWTKTRVYFPVGYGSGKFGVGSVPRDPCGERAEYFGG